MLCESMSIKQNQATLSSSAAIKFLAYFFTSLSNPYVYEIQSSAILLKHLPLPHTKQKERPGFPKRSQTPVQGIYLIS